MARKRKELPLLEKVEITDVAAEGKAIAKVNDLVIFVPYVVPGDVVDLQIKRKKHHYAEAEAVKFHQYVNTVLFLETKSVLAALKDSGARIGIISTKFRYRIKELLDQHFPEDFLDIIIGGEDVQTPKPSPEGLLLAIRQLHATKAETLYIGDSTVDAETAQKAGVDFAGITHGMTTAEELKKYPHKKIMSSLEELLEREPLPAAAPPKNISVRRIALLLLLLAAFAALFCFLLLI